MKAAVPFFLQGIIGGMLCGGDVTAVSPVIKVESDIVVFCQFISHDLPESMLIGQGIIVGVSVQTIKSVVNRSSGINTQADHAVVLFGPCVGLSWKG